jgi:hypothetical protein
VRVERRDGLGESVFTGWPSSEGQTGKQPSNSTGLATAVPRAKEAVMYHNLNFMMALMVGLAIAALILL